MKTLKYSIITTAKNEENYISKTLESVISQTILPVEWVIMNDGSDDKTGIIIDQYAKKYPWINKIELKNFKPEIKSTGGRVGYILNIASHNLKNDFDIITKLDADVEFNSTFFEKMISEFYKDPKLGIASGNLVFEDEIEIIDYTGNETRGAAMLIRKEVFNQVNGFVESRGSGEDTLLSVSARYFGWKTKTFQVFFNHLKPEGKKNSSFYLSYITGFYKGSIPYRFDYFLFTQFKYAFKKPFLIGSFIQLIGYIISRYILNYRPFPEFIKQQIHKEQKNYINSKLTTN
jgi:poly-beta-1,6-N-acetyl-D-glucosamine synthase